MAALGIDAWGLAVQIVAFLVFIYLFWRFALGPITNMLDERSRRISESMAAAEEMKAEMARASVRNEEILAEARQQAQQIISQAREVSEATITRLLRELAGDGTAILVSTHDLHALPSLARDRHALNEAGCS